MPSGHRQHVASDYLSRMLNEGAAIDWSAERVTGLGGRVEIDTEACEIVADAGHGDGSASGTVVAWSLRGGARHNGAEWRPIREADLAAALRGYDRADNPWL